MSLSFSSQLLASFPHDFDFKFQTIANRVQTDSIARRRTSNICCTMPQVDRSWEGKERIQANSTLTDLHLIAYAWKVGREGLRV